MALKDTCSHLKTLIQEINGDLQKAEEGNKAAAQRCRTNSIRFEKAAKLFRKESVQAEKNGGLKKSKASKKKSGASGATAQSKKSKEASPKKVKTGGKKATRKASSTKKGGASSKKAASPKRATAKIPKKNKKR